MANYTTIMVHLFIEFTEVILRILSAIQTTELRMVGQ